MNPTQAISMALCLVGGLSLAACANQGGGARPSSAASASQSCADFSFPIYFETSSDALTAAAQQVVADSAARVKGCRIDKVELLGLADATGSAGANLEISRRRAAIVADALAAAGLPRPAFDVEAAGQLGAVTPGGAPEPLRRRTEVVIRARPN